MAVPTVSVNLHDRYTPELRDKIVDKLRTAPSEAAYHVLTPPLLRELADAVSKNGPVLSFYLQLTPERRVGGAWRSYLSAMSDAMLRSTEDKHTRKTLQEEFARIQQAMEEELPALGRGVAFFACRSLGLWRQIAVPLPLADGAHQGTRPYVRPLVRTRDEHDRFVIAVLSEELGRYFVSQIGQIEEVLQIRGANMRRMLTDHGPKDPHDDRVLEHIWIEGEVFAGAIEQVVARYQARYLVLAEAEDLRLAVIRHLHKELQQRIGAEFPAELHARPAEMAAAAEPAQRAIEEREEVATVQHLLDAGPQRSAYGIEPALRALWERRVATLVVDDMYAAPGARCRTCAALLQTARESCPVCGSETIDGVEDVVELAIEQTLDEDGTFEMVRSPAARQMLTRIGPVAALLRW